MLAFEKASIDNKGSSITGLLASPAGKTAVIAIMQPVMQGEKPIYILSATVPADHFAQSLKQVLLPSGWTSELFDAQGLSIASTPVDGGAPEMSVPQSWLGQAKGIEGLWRGRSIGDVDVTAAYAHSQKTGWTVAVTVPDRILNAPVWQAVWVLLASATALLSLSVFLAYWSAARLSNAIRSLQRAGSRYTGDHSSSTVDTEVKEINEVGLALTNAISRANRRQAQLESILATVPSAMVIIDRKGIVQAFSKSAAKMYGYTSEEICGSNVSRLMPEPDRGRHDGYISHYRETGEKKIIGIGRLVTGMRKNGTLFPVELHVGEANVEGETLFTGFMLDQTEKQRMEQELRQTQKMEAIGKLTGGVAHDFNNLLTVIKGNLEMLEDFVGEQERDLLRDSQEAADLAAQLTTSLLAFGRRMPLNPKRLDVGEMITATGDLLRRTLGETIEINTSIKKTSDAIIDAPQLQNAILNLAINARDAMPGGGRLTIGVSEVDLDEDYAAAYGDVKPGRYIMIAMTDTGTGMSKEVKERAFEPFFTTKPQGSGTGLGLSSVYGFVKQSGGHVALYSEEGHGTTIRLYLPSVVGGKQHAARALAG
jgi:PAS domain S-box-containing protein